MTRYTPDALARLDDYLADVRAAVSGHHSVSPDDIEQDVREHVAAALASAPQPIDVAHVEDVLDRLGPPSQWVADSPRSIWKYLADRMKPVGHRALDQIKALPGEAYVAGRGLVTRVKGMSHDWRLAYLAFGLFTVGLIAFPLFPLFLIASYIAARADLALARERNETLGARRWLIYPPMVLVSLALLIALAAWPIIAAVSLSHDIPRSRWGEVSEVLHVSRQAVQPIAATYFTIGFLSVWWMIGSLVVLRWSKLPALVLPPIGGAFRRIDAMLVFLLSATVFVVWLSFADTAWNVVKLLMRSM